MNLEDHCYREDGKRIVSREYSAWQMLKNRCLNRRCADYGRYGAKGVKLDRQWHAFAGFLQDMGLKPDPNAAIHRFDEGQGFTKGNCYWGPAKRKPKNYSTYNIPPEFRQWASR